MFGNLGVHIMQFPTGKWGYVGTLPTVLATEVPATDADVMGQRAHRDVNGAIVTWKFPVFASEADARIFAALKGVNIVEDK